ncbi:MAG: DNA gyrase subunit A, partial [Bacteroidetes bacterium]|nr:DNA gyrase subunit A [Bacteroidota bacterium]
TGMRVVYEIKREADANVVLNMLYKYTQLQSSFSVNNIALVKGRPVALNLKDMILHYVDHRHEVVIRRTKYDLAEAEKRAHILEGLLIAIDNLDEVIEIIRGSKTPDDARDGLVSRFSLSELQAKAILELRLQRLTGLERDKIKAEYEELMKQITYLKSILNDEVLRMQIIKDEVIDIKKKYGDERKSEIVYAGGELSMEDMIAAEDMVITISHLGYIKRTALRDYKRQNRGGKGSKGANSRDEDFIAQLFVANTHSYMLFFTQMGKCHWMRVYEIPEGNRTTKGRALQNVIQIDKDDQVKAYLAVKNLTDEEYLTKNFVFFCTQKGTIKKTALEAYSRPRQKGIIAINIEEGDTLLDAVLTDDECDVVLATKYGQAIRFHQHRVRSVGRNSTGVIGVRMDEPDDEVVGLVAIKDKDSTILVLSEKGYGKRSEIEDYRITNRGGKGVKTLNITDKTGRLVAILEVKQENDLMIITKNGILIRMAVDDIRSQGRATQGVRLIKISEKDEIASIAKIDKVEEEEEEGLIDGETTEITDVTEAPTNETESTETNPEENEDTE